MTPEEQVKQQTIQTVGPVGDVVRDQDKIMIVLSYLGILCLIPLLTVKDSEYVKWHAKQGLAIFIVWIALNLLHIIPFLGTALACAGFAALLVVDIMAMVKGLNGIRWRIPVITDLAEKF